MKVQVFSSRKEAYSLVGRSWDKDGKEIAYYRQFIPLNQKSSIGTTFMTLDEANFLVESDENRLHAAAGQAKYWYPSGFPVPLPDEKGGPLHAAFGDGSSHISDERQTTAARKQDESRQRVMAAEKAKYDAQVASETRKQDNLENEKPPTRAQRKQTEEG